MKVRRKNNRSSRSELTADIAGELEDILQCPVCYELLRPPVLQCLNGQRVREVYGVPEGQPVSRLSG